ncbi:glycoside hydrolase family 3 C-terminal domain-containing protein [Anaerocolumna xylanovorans]|uniref:Beta-glucosidase n=1 Tax=Anaerocolumna xylanovorans DSM 12503 TaxID=1121345 RepID=A0A1M7YJF0_9FIRM|nr:glycoside hydrolase family 3 C-terminal domain-containing protein [Anaerocolumna xylanovorans]SHO52739.1 beta-glucosidase [Anaerocolumna xylanovorans DSM 12503]
MDVEKLLSEMSLEEKASLCSGADFWHTKSIERLDIPNVMVSDGPHGLRKQADETDHLGLSESVKAVCFPAASALACSFDTNLINTIGEALGDECQAESVSTLLGPGVNMKRSPLCGRNFEYYSEDPYLAGKLAASLVKGIQSKGIGTSVKHFAVNNQEYRRMSISAVADERTLREIYLAAFETIVKEANPTTLMCSYNRINGVYSCENDWLLNKVLRDEWGFEGLVMTDWGAMNDRVAALKAGLDLEMPGCRGIRDKEIVEAVQSGELSEEVLNTAARRVLNLVKHYYDNRKENAVYDKEAHHALARRAAAESAVLLKNDSILPLEPKAKVAFIGKFAKVPRYQGGGSSHINSFKITSALDAVKDITEVTYAQGYDTKEDKVDEAMLKEAIKAAAQAEVAVIFAGLPDAFESEGYDRTHMELPECQNHLIKEIAKVQKNIVVILHNGSPVRMPWLNDIKGLLTVYLGGQAVGGACVDLLYGRVNPSGKLAETYPLSLKHNPSYLNFPGTEKEVVYSEGVFIGYRYYDARDLEVLYPFGYGLSYTDFEYSDLKVTPDSNLKDTDTITVTLKVKNTGKVTGKETVQLYIHDKEASVQRPEKELKGFAKAELAPGEEKEVSFTLDSRSFAYYSKELGDWYVETGDFTVMIGKSSRDIVLTRDISVTGTKTIPFVADCTTTVGDIMKYVKNAQELMQKYGGELTPSLPADDDGSLGEGTAEMMRQMMAGTPLHSIISFGGEFTSKDIQNIIDSLNSQN